MIPHGLPYDEAMRQFRWNVPERFNIGRAVCERHEPNTLAMIVENADGSVRHWTFGQLLAASSRLANTLVARGIKKGDRVAVFLSQSAELTICHLAGYRMGAVVLPLVAACALFPRALTGEEVPRSWKRLVPHGVALAIYLGLRTVALQGEAAMAGLRSGALAAASGIATYLRLVVWPSGLTIFHPEPTPSFRDVIPWLALAGLIVWLRRRPAPAARFGALWLVSALVPLSGLVPIPSATVAERYVYAVLPGLWILLGEATSRIPKRVAWPAAALVLTACAARTVVRTRDWRDDVTLARSAVAVDPRSAPARYNLGVALKDAGDLAGAEREWKEALRLRPEDAETLTQLGTAAAVRGDLVTAEALFRRALSIRPGLKMAAQNLAVLCERTGRSEEACRLRRTE